MICNSIKPDLERKLRNVMYILFSYLRTLPICVGRVRIYLVRKQTFNGLLKIILIQKILNPLSYKESGFRVVT